MKKLSSYVLCFIAGITFEAGAVIKVAVLDSGLIKNSRIRVCEEIDLTNTEIKDEVGHGSNVSGLIDIFAAGADYCQVIYKVYSEKSTVNMYDATILALKHISERKDIQVINYSAGGRFNAPAEQALFKALLNKGIIIVVAAGNEDQNLDKSCNYYPACYDNRLIVVGNWEKQNKRHKLSNYGKYVNSWELGTNKCANSYCKTGTSQAAAIKSGKVINELATKKRDK